MLTGFQTDKLKQTNSYAHLLPSDLTYLKDGRLDAFADLVPNVDVSRHFGQDIGPKGWLALWTSPMEVRRVPNCLLQLQSPGYSL